MFLGSALDDTVANLVIAQLLHLEAEDPDRDISLYINSPGGDMTALFAMYDTMSFLGPDVSTVCVGQAASAAAVLLAGGAPGKRQVLPNARVLIHQPHGGAQGQSSDIEIQVREMVEMRQRMVEILGDPHRPAARADRGRHRPRLHPARRGGGGVRVGRRRDREAQPSSRRGDHRGQLSAVSRRSGRSARRIPRGG